MSKTLQRSHAQYPGDWEAKPGLAAGVVEANGIFLVLDSDICSHPFACCSPSGSAYPGCVTQCSRPLLSLLAFQRVQTRACVARHFVSDWFSGLDHG